MNSPALDGRWPLPIGHQNRSADGLWLRPVRIESVPGFQADDLWIAWQAFLRSAHAIVRGDRELRAARPCPEALKKVCFKAVAARVGSSQEAHSFFAHFFQAHHFESSDASTGPAFLTGYYEPRVKGSLLATSDFAEPILATPDDLQTLNPYPTRAEIESSSHRYTPLLYLRDAIEVFMIQVQGSAAVDLPDGSCVRLTYAGRNGRPYTSIGRILTESGEIPAEEMSLARLKQWVRDAGQRSGEKGRALLHRNESYVFFRRDESESRSIGPIGGAGVPLTPLRSVAVDRNLWPYGLPTFVDAELPGSQGGMSPFRRLMIGQDTGSAILGPARLDLFMGSGDDAGVKAGNIRHRASLYILLPRADDSV